MFRHYLSVIVLSCLSGALGAWLIVRLTTPEVERQFAVINTVAEIAKHVQNPDTPQGKRQLAEVTMALRLLAEDAVAKGVIVLDAESVLAADDDANIHVTPELLAKVREARGGSDQSEPKKDGK